MSFSIIPKNPIPRFLVFFSILYLCWYFLYEFLLHPSGKLDSIAINNTVYFTSHLLYLLGYQPFTAKSDTIRTVGIDGTHGLWIGDPCNGIALFSLFTIFVVAFPGPIKKKLWFIPLGILLIHILNIIRVTILCIIVLKAPAYLEFNHNYTFYILIYGFIFFLWMVWVNKFAKSIFSKKADTDADNKK
jgi:exosortase family protein XrtF